MRDTDRVVAALKEMQAELDLHGLLDEAEKARIEARIARLQERAWKMAAATSAERQIVGRR